MSTVGEILCAFCGMVAWRPVDSTAPDENTVNLRTRPLSIESNEALCSRCWSAHWDAEAQSYISTLKRERRPRRQLPENLSRDMALAWDSDALWDDPRFLSLDDELPPPRRSHEFTCVVCMTLRPINQHHDGDRCVDCFDTEVKPSTVHLTDGSATTARRLRSRCRRCFKDVATSGVLCGPCALTKSA